MSALATTPAGGSVAISVIAPDNLTTVASCGSYSAPGGSCNLPALPSAGTYTIRVVPQSTAGANLTLTLSPDATGALAVNGSATTFSTARVGQNGRYTFSGVQGGVYTLNWSNTNFAGSSPIQIYSPSGSVIGTASFGIGVGASGSLALGLLPRDGVYTIFIDPAGTSTGQVDIQVTGTPAPAPSGDIPIPPWALLLLAGTLLGLIYRQGRIAPGHPSIGQAS